jgi:hypothetical protein
MVYDIFVWSRVLLLVGIVLLVSDFISTVSAQSQCETCKEIVGRYDKTNERLFENSLIRSINSFTHPTE